MLLEKLIPIFTALFFATPVLCGLDVDSSVSTQTSQDYLERKQLRDDLIIKIEEATRKRCPHLKVGEKIIALCHGEERWSKTLDCDHQALFKVSELYHQNIKQTVCSSDEKFNSISYYKNNKLIKFNREGIGIWLSEHEKKFIFEKPLEKIHIDYNPQEKKSNFYTIIIKPEARNKPICDISPDEIIDIVEFHDPNCDLEIMTMETPLIDFIRLEDEDIYQIFQGIGQEKMNYKGCISNLNDLLLLKKRRCLVSQNELPRSSGEELTELRPGKDFLTKIYANSGAGDPIDFSAGGRVSGSRHTFYLYDGKAYNYRDFGNFLWALAYRLASCKKKNVCEKESSTIKCTPSFLSKRLALGGANFNAFLKTYKENIENSRGCSAPPVEGEEENTIILRGDSAPDQAAIKLGLSHPVGDYILQRSQTSYCQALRELEKDE